MYNDNRKIECRTDADSPTAEQLLKVSKIT